MNTFYRHSEYESVYYFSYTISTRSLKFITKNYIYIIYFFWNQKTEFLLVFISVAGVVLKY